MVLQSDLPTKNKYFHSAFQYATCFTAFALILSSQRFSTAKTSPPHQKKRLIYRGEQHPSLNGEALPKEHRCFYTLLFLECVTNNLKKQPPLRGFNKALILFVVSLVIHFSLFRLRRLLLCDPILSYCKMNCTLRACFTLSSRRVSVLYH